MGVIIRDMTRGARLQLHGILLASTLPWLGLLAYDGSALLTMFGGMSAFFLEVLGAPRGSTEALVHEGRASALVAMGFALLTYVTLATVGALKAQSWKLVVLAHAMALLIGAPLLTWLAAKAGLLRGLVAMLS